jgi:hypothetical protein
MNGCRLAVMKNSNSHVIVMQLIREKSWKMSSLILFPFIQPATSDKTQRRAINTLLLQFDGVWM